MSMAAAAMETIEGSLGDFIDNTIVRCVYEYEVQRNDKDSLVKSHLVQSVPPVISPRGFANEHEGRRLSGMNKSTWGEATHPCRQVSGTFSSSAAKQSFKELTSATRLLPSPALQQLTSTSQLLTTGLPPSTTALHQLTSTSQQPTTALHSSGTESATRLECEQGTVVVHAQFPDSAISISENPASEKKHHKVKRQLQQRYYSSQAEEATQKAGAKDVPSQVVEITPNLERFSQGAAKKRLGQWKCGFRDVDPYPDDAPVPKEKMAKYDHGAGSIQVPRRGLGATVLKHIKDDSHFAQIQAAKAEQLNDEAGFLEVEEGEDASRLSQHEIAQNVDVTSATKYFELNLPQFGPYNINYSRNGRHMLLGGAKGHMAAFDWQTKRLLCEFNAMETVHDVRWLHQETLLAAAQKSGVYVYDNQGIELHALTDLDSVLNMEFLPYHFLLCTANAKGYMAYTDVSMGTKVSGYNTGMGRLNVMCQNPANAIIHLGHFSGTVTMWSPNVKGSLVKMLCHKSGVTSVAVDSTGNYMATSAVDRKLRLWDLRTYKMLHSYKLSIGAKSIAFSQRGCLALSTGSMVQIYNDILQNSEGPFLNHLCTGAVQRLQFCPFEDVLGVGHMKGFSSLIVPGSGEANIDALEVNPYATKKQRANAEVRMLLDKIPPEMINLSTKVTEISSQASHSGQKQVPTHKKLGKKEKEQELREKVRDSQNRKFTPKNGNRKSGSDAIFDRFKKKE